MKPLDKKYLDQIIKLYNDYNAFLVIREQMVLSANEHMDKLNSLKEEINSLAGASDIERKQKELLIENIVNEFNIAHSKFMSKNKKELDKSVQFDELAEQIMNTILNEYPTHTKEEVRKLISDSLDAYINKDIVV